MTERKVNDIGGLPAGPVCQDEHPSTLHEKRVDAILRILSGPTLEAFTVDAMRRAIESNTEEDYRNLGYYDKWIRARSHHRTANSKPRRNRSSGRTFAQQT